MNQLLNINETMIKRDSLLVPKTLAEGVENKQLEEQNKVIQHYNENISTLDPMYSNLGLLSGVLVRVLCKEHQNVGGFYIPNTFMEKIKADTRSGVGNRTINNPYAFSQKAIVVATSTSMPYVKPGDFVQLAPEALLVQANSEDDIAIRFAFTHYTYSGTAEMPRLCTDPHYGYLLIPPHCVIAKLNEE